MSQAPLYTLSRNPEPRNTRHETPNPELQTKNLKYQTTNPQLRPPTPNPNPHTPNMVEVVSEARESNAQRCV